MTTANVIGRAPAFPIPSMVKGNVSPVEVLEKYRTIAVVGASKNPEKEAYSVPRYLKDHHPKLRGGQEFSNQPITEHESTAPKTGRLRKCTGEII